VILGGGRHKFFLNDTDKKGSRRDMDLVEFWKKDKTERFGNDKSAYVENREQLLNVDPSKTDYLLGKQIRVTLLVYCIIYLYEHNILNISCAYNLKQIEKSIIYYNMLSSNYF